MNYKTRVLECYGLALMVVGLGALFFAIAMLIGRMMGYEIADWLILGSTFVSTIWFPAGRYIAKAGVESKGLEVDR